MNDIHTISFLSFVLVMIVWRFVPFRKPDMSQSGRGTSRASHPLFNDSRKDRDRIVSMSAILE